MAQNFAMMRRSSVWRVLFENENIDSCISDLLFSPISGTRLFKNANFSCKCRMAMFMTPPPLLPSAPSFLSEYMSLR